MPNFTPGPWFIQIRKEFDEYWIYYYDEGIGNVSVAVVRPGCDKEKQIGDSLEDARLICKAPDLYAMLERLQWIDIDRCPTCGCARIHGHAEDCELDALLNTEQRG